MTYTYGASTETGDANGNVAGRIKKVTMEAGSETRTYDHLGNVKQTQTTLNNMSQSTPATVTFTMKYTYDWLGRMQDMTFPNWMDNNFQFVAGEGEKVSYFYDHGGNLDRITGFDQTANPQQTSAPRSFTYLQHIGYDEFEQRTMLTSGNGIANKYVYEATTRRLSQITASAFGTQEHQLNKPPTPFHKLQYTYDKVGNVMHVVNDVSVQPWRNAGVFVGPMDVTYGYDNLYQLRSMSGKYRPNVAYGYQWSSAYACDEIGNIKTKANSQDRLVWDNQTVNTNDPSPVNTQLLGSRFDHNVSALTYSLAYQYTGSRPHATNQITETLPVNTNVNRTYTYDANGNNTGNTFQGATRLQVWDEESRLKEVDVSGGMKGKFRYDDEGERRKKQTSAGDAWYVNQFFVLLPGNLPTKHIFAGETRLVSKTDAIYMQNPAVSYYHPDPLGTTSYTTSWSQNAANGNQDLLQHERYFAFGELWRPGAEQEECDLGRPDNLRREYTFTSKEWDVDTGLYYFGARYFDPHADVWQSADPILASYMRGESNGGVFTPRNLGLYTYSWNNPVVLQDPDGAAVGENRFLRIGKGLLGAGYGALKSIVPGGFLAPQPGGTLANDSDFLGGQAAGEATVGTAEVLVGGTVAGGGVLAEGPSLGTSTVVVGAGVAVVAQGVSDIKAAGNTLAMANKAAKREEAAPRPSPPTKAEVRADNRAANGGNLTCETCRRNDLIDPRQARGGQPRPPNEGQVAHIDPRSQGGPPTKENLKVLCPECNANEGPRSSGKRGQ